MDHTSDDDDEREGGAARSVDTQQDLLDRLSSRELRWLSEFLRSHQVDRQNKGQWLALLAVPATILAAALIYMVLRPPTTHDRDAHVRKTKPAELAPRSTPRIVSDASAPEATDEGACGPDSRDVYVGSVILIDQERMSATLEFTRCDGASIDLDLRYWVGVGPDRPVPRELPIYVVRSAGRFADERVTLLDGGRRVRLEQIDIWPTPTSFTADPCGETKHLFLMTSSAETTARHLYQYDSISFSKECTGGPESAEQSDPDPDELDERARRQASEDGSQVASAVVTRGTLASQAMKVRRPLPGEGSPGHATPTAPRWRDLSTAQADELADRAARKLITEDDHEGARSECEDVRSTRCLNIMGMVHRRAGRKKEACRAFERALILDLRDGGRQELTILTKQDELGCTDDDLRGASFQ